VLGKLARQHDPNVLVGFDHADDAGVYLLTPDTALVQTVDFFTPVVDDPFTFGQIAATNALSDVYAMGGRPLTSLALVCFPEKGDLGILERILAGGLSKMIEAGCTVVGGHSIRDEETKFGYSVTGVIHPKRVLANKGAQPGDKLLFTKSLGTGVISTAIKKGVAKQEWIDAAVRSMTTLNKAAAEVITAVHVAADAFVRPSKRSEATNKSETTNDGATGVSPVPGERSSEVNKSEVKKEVKPELKPNNHRRTAFDIHALTDVTGFGLIGHAREMALASNVSLVIHSSNIPVLEGALDCIRAGHIPGGLIANRDFAECLVAYDPSVPANIRTVLYDPQTAGGLLISVSAENAAELNRALQAAGVPAVEIGEVLAPAKPLITIH
jgi:selenophosphate synthase